MEPLEWIALIGGILSLAGIGIDAWQTDKANKRQEEHDKAMADLNHRYREEEALTSFEREANFNQYSADYNKMLEANVSPSLMYGGISSSAPSVSSVGSSQSAGNVGRKMNVSDFLGKLDPGEYASQTIERMNAKTMQERMKAQNALDVQSVRESISRQLENQRNTSFKKRLEKTILDQEDQTLKNLKTQGEQMSFNLQYARDTRDINYEMAQLGNAKMRKEIDLTVEKIKSEPVARQKMRAEITEIDAITHNYRANTALLGEDLHNTQLHRVMQEFGINARSINGGIRNLQNITPGMQRQMNAAKLTLESLGFSEYEASEAVLYYCATDKKDVTPSTVNALSRLLSSALK